MHISVTVFFHETQLGTFWLLLVLCRGERTVLDGCRSCAESDYQCFSGASRLGCRQEKTNSSVVFFVFARHFSPGSRAVAPLFRLWSHGNILDRHPGCSPTNECCFCRSDLSQSSISFPALLSRPILYTRLCCHDYPHLLPTPLITFLSLCVGAYIPPLITVWFGNITVGR